MLVFVEKAYILAFTYFVKDVKSNRNNNIQIQGKKKN